MRWREENSWSSLGAGDRIPDMSLVLGSFSWAQGAVNLIIHGTWEDLYVESSVVHSQQESLEGRHPLRLMPMVDHWRGSDGLLVGNVRKGCDCSIRLEFTFNGVSFDPNRLGPNPRCTAQDYGFYWWRPEQQEATEMMI